MKLTYSPTKPILFVNGQKVPNRDIPDGGYFYLDPLQMQGRKYPPYRRMGNDLEVISCADIYEVYTVHENYFTDFLDDTVYYSEFSL